MRECYCPLNPAAPHTRSSYQQTNLHYERDGLSGTSSSPDPQRLYRPGETSPRAFRRPPTGSPSRFPTGLSITSSPRYPSPAARNIQPSFGKTSTTKRVADRAPETASRFGRRNSTSPRRPSREPLSPATSEQRSPGAKRAPLTESTPKTSPRNQFRPISPGAQPDSPHSPATPRRDFRRSPSRPKGRNAGFSPSRRPKPQQQLSAPGESSRIDAVYLKMCIHEKILSEHIRSKILEERMRYDAALVRANTMLEQTKKLKEQVRELHEGFDVLENDFQTVTTINMRFRRAARTRIEYLDEQLQLAELIGKLIAQDQEKNVLGLRRRFPGDAGRAGEELSADASPRPRMSRRKRKFLYRLLCAKGFKHGSP